MSGIYSASSNRSEKKMNNPISIHNLFSLLSFRSSSLDGVTNNEYIGVFTLYHLYHTQI